MMPAADKRAIARVARQVAVLMRGTPDLLDIEINPLVAAPDGVLALDTLMIMG